MIRSNFPNLVLKIDVDTERGTRIGVPNLVALLKELKIPATFFFALGRDNTGRAIKRIFRRGFFSKVKRTNVISTYGFGTLLNGILFPGPHIGRRHERILRDVKAAGFSVGIHCYDHVLWQDGVAKMSEEDISKEFTRALLEFQRIFNNPAEAAAAPGWQANEKTLSVYDRADLTYASDCRGTEPFFPKIGTRVFKTLQIPTTLPTLDEMIGLPDHPLMSLINYFVSLIQNEHPNVMTIHSELEGMKYIEWFREFLLVLKQKGVDFCDLETISSNYLQNRNDIPICEIVQDEVAGRSGKLAVQKRCRVI